MASASTWPLSRQTALDLNGDVVPGARLFFFEAGTASTPLTVFEDPALTVPLPAFPDAIEADSNGRWPRIYLPYEDYRERVTTPEGVLLWDDDGIANPAPPTADTTVPISERVQTGMLALSFGLLDGYVPLNGQTIGNAVSGATARAADDTKALFVFIYDNVDDAIAPVSGTRGSNAETDFAAGKTITLPNFQGRALTGLIGMGGTASTLLDAVSFTAGTKTDAGAQFGAATHQLTTGQLPTITPTGSVNITSQGVSPAPFQKNGTGSLAAPQENDFWKGSGPDVANTGIAASFTGNAFGSNQAHPNTQPSALVYVLVKL